MNLRKLQDKINKVFKNETPESLRAFFKTKDSDGVNANEFIRYQMKTKDLMVLEQITKDLSAEIDRDRKSINDKKRRLNKLNEIIKNNVDDMNYRVNQQLIAESKKILH